MREIIALRPHIRILPVTPANIIRIFNPLFTRWNIRTSHIRRPAHLQNTRAR